jgi:hypothetical protein
LQVKGKPKHKHNRENNKKGKHKELKEGRKEEMLRRVKLIKGWTWFKHSPLLIIGNGEMKEGVD